MYFTKAEFLKFLLNQYYDNKELCGFLSSGDINNNLINILKQEKAKLLKTTNYDKTVMQTLTAFIFLYENREPDFIEDVYTISSRHTSKTGSGKNNYVNILRSLLNKYSDACIFPIKTVEKIITMDNLGLSAKIKYIHSLSILFQWCRDEEIKLITRNNWVSRDQILLKLREKYAPLKKEYLAYNEAQSIIGSGHENSWIEYSKFMEMYNEWQKYGGYDHETRLMARLILNENDGYPRRGEYSPLKYGDEHNIIYPEILNYYCPEKKAIILRQYKTSHVYGEYRITDLSSETVSLVEILKWTKNGLLLSENTKPSKTLSMICGKKMTMNAWRNIYVSYKARDTQLFTREKKEIARRMGTSVELIDNTYTRRIDEYLQECSDVVQTQDSAPIAEIKEIKEENKKYPLYSRQQISLKKAVKNLTRQPMKYKATENSHKHDKQKVKLLGSRLDDIVNKFKQLRSNPETHRATYKDAIIALDLIQYFPYSEKTNRKLSHEAQIKIVIMNHLRKKKNEVKL